ncbi:hypothetical protein ASPACDRAFT_39118 [Aspergillus aculeatus ATCC 16872]|uniref:Uncharacterized protein n=1 Tax=Aspergillus aculeatus (strain ATCC 16872 / CBS 172.66 / WB 5094) TaxID=690307 RepID=A0A1L9X4X2_ASPA1|nr:uncharacterized protein ASPACDRAFT_39118 [Aspergillus aculeatus ATCC 16872]OJK03501.1 hypothetical protein ASPACDRAFT_39118 [Aspergillus aculeatus ATCC 16872]
MKLALTLLPALAGLAVAEEVVSMLLWAVDRDQDYEASIVGNDATATTYSLACPTSVSGSACSIGRAGITAEIVDQSTYAWWRRQYSTTWACTADGTTDGVCHRTLSGQDQGFDIYFTNFLSATVTAGAVTGGSGVSETASATSTTLAHASMSTDSASASQESLSSTITSAPTTTASADGDGDATVTQTSTGGVPRITGAAGLVVGGAAVALMGAVL